LVSKNSNPKLPQIKVEPNRSIRIPHYKRDVSNFNKPKKQYLSTDGKAFNQEA